MTTRTQRRIVGLVIAVACSTACAATVVEADTVGSRSKPAPDSRRASGPTTTGATSTATAALTQIVTVGSGYTASSLPGNPGATSVPAATTVPPPTTTTTSTTVTSASTSTTASVPSPAQAAPDLGVLVARSRQSPPGQEIATVAFIVTSAGTISPPIGSRVVLRRAPYQFAITGGSARVPIGVRFCGGYVYVYEARAAALDGGRPWVQETPAQFGYYTYGERPRDTIVAQLLSLPTLVKAATTLKEVGASAINGQTVTEFKGYVQTSRLDRGVSPSPGVDAVDMFVSDHGVVLRFTLSNGSLQTTTNVVSTAGPLVVNPPALNRRIAVGKLSAAARRLVLGRA